MGALENSDPLLQPWLAQINQYVDLSFSSSVVRYWLGCICGYSEISIAFLSLSCYKPLVLVWNSVAK